MRTQVFGTDCECTVTAFSNQCMRICRIPEDGSADSSAKLRRLLSLKIQEHASWCGSGGLHKHAT